jgi:phosphopantothenoylcysteine decarboxylase/phosphopantothenate--cysteine ligase
MNILITAGPTREYIDPIRFITNASSGKQGIAIAEFAKKKGHNVILVMGPSAVEMPKEIPMVCAATAEDMYKSVLQYKDWMDALVMNAAVSDWRAQKISKRKIKKTKKTFNLKLVNNPDILSNIGRLKKQKKLEKKPVLVGFCVETENLIINAKKKLKEKNLDVIVANPREAIGSNATEPVIIDKSGKIIELPLMTKKDIARKIIKLVECYRSN